MTYWGLLKRKETVVLTWRGRLFLMVIAIAVLLIIARYLHLFLATSRPNYGEILIVEGWMPDSALKQAVLFFNKNNYQLILTTGGPLTKGSYLSKYSTYAGVAAATLGQLGVEQRRIVPVPAPLVRRDRTFASALAVNNWLSQSNIPIHSVDVISMGTHARRTQWLFQKALGDSISVGIIAAPSPGYDANKWWDSSSGVRTLIGETIAYLYARFLFDPKESPVVPPS